MSVNEPAANGTTMRMERSGQLDCASAGRARRGESPASNNVRR